MALKADRYEFQTDISFFYNAGVAERGGVVCHSTTVGSGAAMDQGVNLVEYAAANGKVPVGVLLNDVVNKDLTTTHLNRYKNEVQKGGKVTLLRKGYVVTNMLAADATVVGTEVAFASDADPGLITNSGDPHQAIGRFLSAKDADGYAKVEVNLPHNTDA